MRQQGTQTDQTTNFFWLIALIAGALIILWFTEEQYIVQLIFGFRYYEACLIYKLANFWLPIAKYLHLPLPDLIKWRKFQVEIQQNIQSSSEVNFQQFILINDEIGEVTRYFTMIIFFGLAILVYFLFCGAHFHKTYDMKSLRFVGEKIWPQITPIVPVNLIKTNIDDGPWSMAKLPLSFCREHNLLLVKMVDNRKRWGVKQKLAHRLFSLQLGSLWPGLENLPIYMKALILIFLLRATGQRAASVKFLLQIASSSASEKLDFAGVKEGIEKFRDHKIIHWIEKRHQYTVTIMSTLLEIARSDGVLATAEFLWLKLVDRRLWYVLNSVGRRTVVIEVAGVYSHWLAEKKLGRGLKTPMIKNAIDALEEELANILYIEEVEQWRTSNEA